MAKLLKDIISKRIESEYAPLISATFDYGEGPVKLDISEDTVFYSIVTMLNFDEPDYSPFRINVNLGEIVEWCAKSKNQLWLSDRDQEILNGFEIDEDAVSIAEKIYSVIKNNGIVKVLSIDYLPDPEKIYRVANSNFTIIVNLGHDFSQNGYHFQCYDYNNVKIRESAIKSFANINSVKNGQMNISEDALKSLYARLLNTTSVMAHSDDGDASIPSIKSYGAKDIDRDLNTSLVFTQPDVNLRVRSNKNTTNNYEILKLMGSDRVKTDILQNLNCEFGTNSSRVPTTIALSNRAVVSSNLKNITVKADYIDLIGDHFRQAYSRTEQARWVAKSTDLENTRASIASNSIVEKAEFDSTMLTLHSNCYTGALLDCLAAKINLLRIPGVIRVVDGKEKRIDHDEYNGLLYLDLFAHSEIDTLQISNKYTDLVFTDQNLEYYNIRKIQLLDHGGSLSPNHYSVIDLNTQMKAKGLPEIVFEMA